MFAERDRFLMNESLWLVTSPTHVPVYDFDFRQYFECRYPYEAQAKKCAVARIGAIHSYKQLYEDLLSEGIELINTPGQHERASSLPEWYPRLAIHTPYSRWFPVGGWPDFNVLEEEFGLPFFLKGARQTSRHQAALSIIRSRADFENARAAYSKDPILHWQELVCRKFVPLRSVAGFQDGGRKIPASFEFRTFWWEGQYVGGGRYWYEGPDYRWSESERRDALALGQVAASAMSCGFFVVDLAMTQAGEWIIIECNDAMESGYAGAPPIALWERVLELCGGESVLTV